MLKSGRDYVIGADLSLRDAVDVDTDFGAVGGFHTLCTDVGEIPGHPLSRFQAGDPLPSSLWNLNHRAKGGNNAGMVYEPTMDVWVDIYLFSYSDRKIRHETVDDYQGIALKMIKRLPAHEEFSSLAEGSNELTYIKDSQYVSIAGGHVDTLGRRMISNIGCEDCAGLVWQWLSSMDPADPQYRLLAGGGRGCAAACGSRYRRAGDARWAASAGLGARFVSEPLYPRTRSQAQ